jgi:hypothetical protein
MKTHKVTMTLPTRKANGEIVNLPDDAPSIRVIREDLASLFKAGLNLPVLSAGAARDRDILVREAGDFEFPSYNAADESRGGKVRNPESARAGVERYLRVFGSNVKGIPEGYRITVSANTLGETREYQPGQDKQNDGWLLFYLSPA